MVLTAPVSPSPNESLRPLRVGIAGMGGFAASHHRTVAALEKSGHCRLICTCDPQAATLGDELAFLRFEERRVRVFSDYLAMLAACHRDLDYVVIATPIPLHAPMHAEAVALRVPVYLEKPPTLVPAELERMLAAESAAPSATLVAFNYIVEPSRLALKRRLLAGEFGKIRRLALRASCPRPIRYFQRAPWAGRLLLEDRLVLDSCLGNAVAHSVHNMLFWSGRGQLWEWDAPQSVRATLHRAHAIESADTFFVEARLCSGSLLRIGVTHAGQGTGFQEEIVECENATLHCEPGLHLEARWKNGRVERFDCSGFDGIAENHLAYHRYLRGENPRPATTLADSRPFVDLHALAHLSADQIRPFAAPRISSAPAPVATSASAPDTFLAVRGLEQALNEFAAGETWPEGAPGAPVTIDALPGLPAKIHGFARGADRPEPATFSDQ